MFNYDPTKKCLRCEKDLALFKFAKRTSSKDGLQVYCRNCMKALRKKTKLRKPPATKACAICKQVLPNSQFWKNKAQRDGLQSYCIPCNKIKNSEYRNDPVTKDRLALSNWLWRQDNIERYKATSRVRYARYRERHKEELRLRQIEYRKRQKYKLFRSLLEKRTPTLATSR